MRLRVGSRSRPAGDLVGAVGWGAGGEALSADDGKVLRRWDASGEPLGEVRPPPRPPRRVPVGESVPRPRVVRLTKFEYLCPLLSSPAFPDTSEGCRRAGVARAGLWTTLRRSEGLHAWKLRAAPRRVARSSRPSSRRTAG